MPGPEPLPIECPEARGVATCLESFLVTPDEPFSLPVRWPGCGCCPETSCATLVDYAARTIHLTMGVCPDPCDCDGCSPIVGGCDIPALERGIWTVVANGAEAFALPVDYDSGFVPPPNACATYAEDDFCSPRGAVPGVPVDRGAITGVCAEPSFISGAPETLSLTRECWPCDIVRSTCTAALEERFTDDLPPGGEIRLDPREYFTGCLVSCTDECVDGEHRCEVPPLNPGHYYRVWLGDEMVHDFTAGSADGICTGG